MSQGHIYSGGITLLIFQRYLLEVGRHVILEAVMEHVIPDGQVLVVCKQSLGRVCGFGEKLKQTDIF